MAIAIEIGERQKNHLLSLLTIKAANTGVVNGLQEEIKRAIAPMDQEDIAWVEKLAGVKAL
ncbi:MAG: hypothetical protein FWD03_07975 [Defluviitaleaceae bacterium]|nr:hypothetical protein [Defluviitaleaceae bacterium]